MQVASLALAVVAALVAPAVAGGVDPGTVQSAALYELKDDGKCPALVDRDGRVCGVARRIDLRGPDRVRALTLVNDNLKGGAKGCASAPRHAVVFETTRGLRAIDVNFGCHTLGGRALSQKAERELGAFFRLNGLVNGLNGL